MLLLISKNLGIWMNSGLMHEKSRMEHIVRLEKIGGWAAVDESWVETIRKSLDLN